MTLILTTLTPDWIVQVSDMRITDGAGPRHDRAHKALPCLAPVGRRHGLLSYYGLAEVQNADGAVRSMSDWLSEAFATASAQPEAVRNQQFYKLMCEVEKTVAKTKSAHPTWDDQLTILFTGFDPPDSVPAVFYITNFGDCGLTVLPDEHDKLKLVKIEAHSDASSGKFHLSGLRPNEIWSMLVNGDTRGLLPEALNRMGAELRLAQGRDDPHGARAAMVDAVNSAFEIRRGGTVSGDCWSNIIRKDHFAAEFKWHVQDPNNQVRIPPAIVAGARMQMIITQELPGTAEALRRLQNGLDTDTFDGPTILAFLRWSPILRSLSAVARACGLLVSQQQYALDVLMLVEYSGRRCAFTLEKHLRDSLPWAEDLIRELATTTIGHSNVKILIHDDYLLAATLVALRPEAYPMTKREAFAWPISQHLVDLAFRHNKTLSKSLTQ